MKWCAYLDAHAERVYSLANDNAWVDAELVRRIETGKLRGSLNVRLIQRGLPGTLRAEDVYAACEVLEEHGWLALEEVQRPRGRLFTIAHINPRGDRTKSVTVSAATASNAPS